MYRIMGLMGSRPLMIEHRFYDLMTKYAKVRFGKQLFFQFEIVEFVKYVTNKYMHIFNMLITLLGKKKMVQPRWKLLN